MCAGKSVYVEPRVGELRLLHLGGRSKAIVINHRSQTGTRFHLCGGNAFSVDTASFLVRPFARIFHLASKLSPGHARCRKIVTTREASCDGSAQRYRCALSLAVVIGVGSAQHMQQAHVPDASSPGEPRPAKVPFCYKAQVHRLYPRYKELKALRPHYPLHKPPNSH